MKKAQEKHTGKTLVELGRQNPDVVYWSRSLKITMTKYFADEFLSVFLTAALPSRI